MAKAESNIPWLALREAVTRVARYLGCTPEDAELRIVGKAKAGQIKACGVIEGRPVSLLPAAWQGATDLVSTTMRPPPLDASSSGDSYEITNLELCFIDLVATGLLPTPAERARWSAEQAVAYLVKGVPLPWKEWQGAGATASEIERAEIDLGEAISEGVPAWGWHPLERRRKRIPSDDFRDEMIEKKALPVSVAHLPKVVVRIDGNVGTWPPSRIAEYIGPLWRAIEVDSARLRQAFPKPLRVERRMLDEAEQLAEGGSEPAAGAEESMPPAPLLSPQVEPEPPPEPKQPAPERTATRRGRPGPRPGTIARFVQADRALFPEMTTLIVQQHITAGEAARLLSDKIKGRGGGDSKIRRLAKRYRTEVEELTATRRNP